MTKTWTVRCETCYDNEWTVKTQAQAMQLKAIHESNDVGHEVKVKFDG